MEDPVDVIVDGYLLGDVAVDRGKSGPAEQAADIRGAAGREVVRTDDAVTAVE
jgi:hypothetical protein